MLFIFNAITNCKCRYSSLPKDMRWGPGAHPEDNGLGIMPSKNKIRNHF